METYLIGKVQIRLAEIQASPRVERRDEGKPERRRHLDAGGCNGVDLALELTAVPLVSQQDCGEVFLVEMALLRFDDLDFDETLQPLEDVVTEPSFMQVLLRQTAKVVIVAPLLFEPSLVVTTEFFEGSFALLRYGAGDDVVPVALLVSVVDDGG